MGSKRKKIPTSIGLWPMSLILRWLNDNGYEKEAAEIRGEINATEVN